MNALIKQIADFTIAANGGLPKGVVIVEDFSLEPLRNDADYVVAWLSNGRVLSVKWDQMNDREVLLLAESNEVEGVEVSAAETCLSEGSLKALVDAAFNAYCDWWADYGISDSYQPGPNEDDHS